MLGLWLAKGNNSRMQTQSGAQARPSFSPANWPAWLAVGLIYLLGRIPKRLGVWLSYPLGGLMRGLMGSRARIATRNIERCFPEMDEAAQRELVKACFQSLALALLETCWCWTSAPSRILRMGHLEGFENLVEAHNKGRGVLVVTAHMTCLELGGFLLGYAMLNAGMNAAGIYRPLKTPVLEWFQNRSRLRYAGLIRKRELRSAIRHLRGGGVIWYAPDQDFGPDQSEFAPFFGIETASLLATHKLARVSGCVVVPMFPAYDRENNRYVVRVMPALEDFPSDNEMADLERINQLTEAFIRTVPEQYWWIHRRFKTRPPGEKPFYS